MTAAPANPPAVVKGSPRAYRRTLPYFWLCMVLMVLPAIAAGLAITLEIDQFKNQPMPHPMLGVTCSVQLIGWLGMCAVVYQQFKAIRSCRRSPRRCLNCYYDLSESEPLCPECGCTQNREDLNKRWERYLGVEARSRASCARSAL